MASRMTRREFLERSALWGLASWGAGRYASSALAQPRSRVVLVRNPRVLQEGQVNPEVVEEMVNQGILALTGKGSLIEAWSTFFRPEDVVGIKLNCLFGRGASTHPAVAAAVVKGVQQAGVRPENIILWDRSDGDLRKAGYTINRGGPGVQCYGTEGDYDPEPTQNGSFRGRLSRILSQRITALVNAPMLKDHSIAGITISMKNHYGSFHNPSEHHGNNCDPYMADLNAVPAIRQKTRLIVCDALQPIADGGPGLRNPRAKWDYGAILLSTDPVALDYYGWRILEERRKELGLPSLADVGRPPRQLASAAQRGLGTSDPNRIELIEI